MSAREPQEMAEVAVKTGMKKARRTWDRVLVSSFLAGAYSGFAQTFGDPGVAQTNPNIGFYAQDEWKAAPGLTLNLGLRYDLQFLQTIATDATNLSPRMGFAWAPPSSTGWAGSSPRATAAMNVRRRQPERPSTYPRISDGTAI